MFGFKKKKHPIEIEREQEAERLAREQMFITGGNLSVAEQRKQRLEAENLKALQKEMDDWSAASDRKYEEIQQAEAGLKYVIDTAKIECPLCTDPEGVLKVNFDTPSIQNKRTATVKEKSAASLIFKGNCKKSPQSASPCASVMQPGEWQDTGSTKIQGQSPLLLKSTIPCNYGGATIKITDCAQRCELTSLNTMGAPVPDYEEPDFDISLTLDSKMKTVVPLGIPDYQNNNENPYFSFEYRLSKAAVDTLNFQILAEDGTVIYQMIHLPPVIISAPQKEALLTAIEQETGAFSSFNSKTEDNKNRVEKDLLFSASDYTKQGTYMLHWDGFDSNGIYDSTLFNGKKLRAKITAVKDGRVKSCTIEFKTAYSEVNWTDVIIDKNKKRIAITLRVNLKDGGAKGLDKRHKVPETALIAGKDPVSVRTKSFEELKQLAIEGITKHWSRKGNYTLELSNEKYKVFVQPINTTKNSMDEVSLIYNTNNNWMRSGNPSRVKDIYSVVGNLVSGQRIAYNVGYLNNADWYEILKNDWYYAEETRYKIPENFAETSAHEIGHEILQAYGGTKYSYTHDGSSKITQKVIKIKDGGKSYFLELAKEELNLMYYFEDQPWSGNVDYDKIVASEKDVLGLIWLTKLKVK